MPRRREHVAARVIQAAVRRYLSQVRARSPFRRSPRRVSAIPRYRTPVRRRGVSRM